MLKRFNWRLVFGVLLIVTGIITLFADGDGWVNAGYELLFGVGLLVAYYADKHPERARGPLAWALVIVWGVAFIAFTFMQSNRG